MPLSFGIDTANGSAVFQCSGKYTESAAFYDFRYVLQFHAETDIRFVRAETVHGFLPGHTLDRQLYIHADLFKNVFQETLIDINNIVHINERKLHIDLCELRLTVCS